MDNHKKKLSIKDIAAISGVSIATVSRVLNNKGGYSKETEEKINALAKSYGYVSNMNAKSLRESKSQTIGLIVPDTVSYTHLDVYKRQSKTCTTTSFNCVINSYK